MNKKQQLKSKINEFIDAVVDIADSQGKLDYINIVGKFKFVRR